MIVPDKNFKQNFQRVSRILGATTFSRMTVSRMALWEWYLAEWCLEKLQLVEWYLTEWSLSEKNYDTKYKT